MYCLGVQFGCARAPFHAAFVAVGAMLLLSALASDARATCGDYLQMPDGHAAADQAANPEEVPNSNDAPCDCRGPECHRAPLAPPQPKAPLRSYSQQDGNLLLLADRSLTLQRTWTRHRLDARPNRGYPLLLNRPPDVLA
jgi:hypothetical protein